MMKNFLSFLLLLFFVSFLQAQEAEINGCDITIHNRSETISFEAYGNVYIETNPKKPVDIYVKIVDSPNKATYKVFKTTDTPKKCGEWRFVSDRSKAKFTIRYVKELEDCSVYFTNDPSKAGWF